MAWAMNNQPTVGTCGPCWHEMVGVGFDKLLTLPCCISRWTASYRADELRAQKQKELRALCPRPDCPHCQQPLTMVYISLTEVLFLCRASKVYCPALCSSQLLARPVAP